MPEFSPTQLASHGDTAYRYAYGYGLGVASLRTACVLDASDLCPYGRSTISKLNMKPLGYAGLGTVGNWPADPQLDKMPPALHVKKQVLSPPDRVQL